MAGRAHGRQRDRPGRASTTSALRRELEIAAADNVKRVRRPDTDDWTADPGLSRMRSFLETKTVWHPIGV